MIFGAKLGAIFALLLLTSLALSSPAAGPLAISLASPFLVFSLQRNMAALFPALGSGFVLSGLLIPWVFGSSIDAVLFVVGANLGLAGTGAMLLRYALGSFVEPKTQRDALAVIVSGAAIPAFAHWGPLVELLVGSPGIPAAENYLAACLSAMLGATCIAPLIFFRPNTSIADFRQKISLGKGLGLIALATAVALFLDRQSTLPGLFLIFPVLMWVAVRLGAFETGALAVCLVGSSLIWSMLHHGDHDFLHGLPAEKRLIVIQLILLISAAAPFITAVLLDSLAQANAALTMRNAGLQGILRALPDILFHIDQNAIVQNCRVGHQVTLKIEPERFLSASFERLLPNSALANFRSALHEVKSGTQLARFEFEFEKNGSRVFLEANMTPVFQSDFLVLVRDVTSERVSRMALEKRADQLVRSNAELEQFAYVASHDLQEPLRTVASFCELLQQRYASKLDDSGREFIHFAVDGSKRLQGLIKDLLQLSRVTSRGKLPAPFALGDAVDAVRAILAQELETHRAVLINEELPTINADQAQIQLALQHLIENAIKFRALDAPKIWVSCVESDHAWQIQVADNGIGFSNMFKERIFQIFQRLHTRDAYPGNGVGLALVRKIADRHGGRAWASARTPQGSMFCLELPKDPIILAGCAEPDSGRANGQS